MAERTIFLKKRPIRKEGIADSAIVPGMLVKLASDGKFDPHPTAKAQAVPAFAFENELTSHESGGVPIAGAAIDVAYAQNDRLYYGVCDPGAEVYALVAPSAAAVVKGDLLESAGDGTLRKLTPASQLTSGNYTFTTEGHAIAMALEAVDNSADAVNRARIIVEIL